MKYKQLLDLERAVTDERRLSDFAYTLVMNDGRDAVSLLYDKFPELMRLIAANLSSCNTCGDLTAVEITEEGSICPKGHRQEFPMRSVGACPTCKGDLAVSDGGAFCMDCSYSESSEK